METGAHSVLAYAIYESMNDILAAHSNEAEVIRPNSTQFINDKGDIYIPLRVSTDPENRNIPRFTSSDGRIRGNKISFQDFRSKYLDDEIITLQYNKSISISSLLKNLSSQPDIYGCLLKKDNFVINPMHPMVAFLVAANLIELPEEGELHIYKWKMTGLDADFRMGEEEAKFTRYANRWKSEYQKYFELAPSIILDEQRISYTTEIDQFNLDAISNRPLWGTIERSNITIIKQIESTGDSPEGLLIPLQIAADGILTPYYGVASIDDPTDSVRGFNLSPMATGNFNASPASPLDRQSGNVCTGDASSRRKTGWLTLSRVNLNSMYYNTIVDIHYSPAFVKVSKEISSNIWTTIFEKEQAELRAHVEGVENQTSETDEEVA